MMNTLASIRNCTCMNLYNLKIILCCMFLENILGKELHQRHGTRISAYGESHTSRVAPLEDASTYASGLAYVCTASTDVTVVGDINWRNG